MNLSVTVQGEGEEEALKDFAISFLRERGYVVELPRDWETPTQLAERLGTNIKHVWRCLRHPACPYVDLERGKKRVLRFASNSLFDQFVRRNLV